nr:immunoglobulin heavy chain junction region [Macaca mulatta]
CTRLQSGSYYLFGLDSW